MEYTVKAGDKAFYDSYGSGLVPVKVVKIEKDGDDLVAKLQVTATRKAYVKGETIHVRPGVFLVARDQVFTRSGHFMIRGRTDYVVG